MLNNYPLVTTTNLSFIKGLNNIGLSFICHVGGASFVVLLYIYLFAIPLIKKVFVMISKISCRLHSLFQREVCQIYSVQIFT